MGNFSHLKWTPFTANLDSRLPLARTSQRKGGLFSSYGFYNFILIISKKNGNINKILKILLVVIGAQLFNDPIPMSDVIITKWALKFYN